ncbi:PucR family transcriptional regulator [Kutzneria buriramensis]|uniref:PucR-like helix-turn-helix protein n=1 Tax=Kutzneria buriramensis TaxID=1045776 RepID=A0A3E0GUJ4_9PSEU|nr:PucR family transcriptional regulator [Kutzneria buriramensis]REH26169.1 PucR-like helix-turn-helix protein [Kutzneria buriramensis]
MTTLRDLLAEPALRLDLLVGGDLDREIRWVHVTELADASPYLVGGELVLTAGIWRGRRHSAAAFVAALRRRDVAGIGYGLLEGDELVPTAVVRACRERGVPLFLVPISTPFIAITQWFVDRLADKRERSLHDALKLSADLLAAAELDEPRSALAQVARLVCRSTGLDVWICDGDGRELARAGAQVPSGDVREGVPGWTAFPIGIRHDAVIAVRAATVDVEVRPRLDAASPVVGLILAKERAVRESERRLAGEVISLILGRQFDTAAARMPYYDLDPLGPLVAMVSSVADREAALRAAERWLTELDRSGVVALRGNELMFVLTAQQLDDAAIRDLARDLAARLGAIATGTGPVVARVSDLRRSLVQARHACELGRRRGGGVVVSHDLSGDHNLLLALQDQDVLDTFRESLLAPLAAYDAEHHADLELTLTTFLETGGRWQDTAELLHIHVNTLRHRLGRVEQLTRKRLDSTPDRVDLWLALKASRAGTPDT